MSRHNKTSLDFDCPSCGAPTLRFCKTASEAPMGDVRVWDSCIARMRMANVFTHVPFFGLTLWQPWSWVIAHGGVLAKRIENRDWPPPDEIIGRRVAIHAGKTVDIDAVEYLTDYMSFDAEVTKRPRGKPLVTAMSTVDRDENQLTPVPLVLGAIESIATIAGAVSREGKRVGMEGITDAAIKAILHDPYFSGEWGFFLVDVVTLPMPITCKGNRKFWSIEEPEREAIRHQLRELAA